MSKYVEIIVGAALLATGIAGAAGVVMFTAAFTTFAAHFAGTLIALGISTTLAGIGTLLVKGPLQGLSTAARNPTAPWNIIYGRSRPGGTIVYMQETGEDNRYLQMVIVLACHPCLSVDALLFDNQRVVMDTNGDSHHPSQQTVSISSITRVEDVVTVVMSAPLPPPISGMLGGTMVDGDRLRIHDVDADESLNGIYPIAVVNATTFTYICGGPAVAITSEGHVTTVWPDFSTTVHMEILLGNQTGTFPGLLASGDTGSQGLWTNQHLLLGKCAVYLRLWYHDNIYQSGVPSISFLVHGKCDLYDPRNGTVLARPTVLMNGWGHNAHEGPYELGEDQATNWGLNDDTTYPYGYAERACDSDLGSCASEIATHTHTYFGCIYQFAALASAPSDLYLNVYSSVPSDGSSGWLRSGGVWYSLDGGSTWILLYNEASKPLEWDSVHLSTSQDASQVQVMIFMDSHDDMAHSVYDIQLATGPGSSGYSENAAVCIADYLSNQIWGFKAQYGTEIPYPELISAANICDEDIPLAAGGTEKRYQANGIFLLSMKRGEVLQNLLTSCGGRLTYSGGQFVIHPAAWPGVSFAIGGKPVASATVYVVSENISASDGTSAFSNITIGPAAVGGAAHDILYGPGPLAKQTNSGALNSTELAAGIDQLEIYCRNFHTLLLDTDPLDPVRVLIYDCWLVAVHPDGSSTTYKPSRARIEQPDTAFGRVDDPALAIDATDTTAATIERWHYHPVADLNICSLVLSQFVPVGGSGPPDTSAGAMEVSALALSQAAGPFRWKSKLSSRDLYNGVKGTYVSPANSWQSSDIPAYAQDTKHGYPSDVNLAADGGDRRWLDIQLPFTLSPSCAQRLAKIELLRRRQQGTGTFAFNLALYKTTALDIVSFTLPLLGWSGKLLEVAAHRFTIQKGEGEGDSAGTLLATELDLQETDPSVYEWNPLEELTPQGFQQPSLPSATSMRSVSPPTGVTAVSGSSTSVIGADGIARSRILTSWTPPADGFVTDGGHMEVQYRLSSGSGGTGPTDIERIAEDQWSSGTTAALNEGHPHGVPSDWDFYSSSFISMGNNPAGNAAIEFWGDLYIDATGNPATNTLVNVRHCQIWWLRASTNVWTQGVLTDAPEVGSYAEDFSTDYGLVTPRTESDGSISFNTGAPGRMAHFYAPFPRISIPPTDIGGIVSILEGRLLMDNPAGTDDRGIAKYLLEAGGDYYPATTGPGITGNPGIGGGKFKYVNNDWNTFCFSTLTLAELNAHPPPVDFSDFTSSGDAGAWTGLPSVDPSVTQVYIDGVTDGQTYDVQVRSVNTAGTASGWVAAPPVTVGGTASVIPPTTISGSGADEGDTLTWDGSAWVPMPPSGGGGGAEITETPAGTMNGTNVAFTLSFTPITGTLTLWLNGVEQVPTVDYTISGITITYTVAPKSTDLMVAEYMH